MTEERWLDVPGWAGWYKVSDHGRIMRVVAGRGAIANRILKPMMTLDGYCNYALSRPGDHKFYRKSYRGHRLVLIAFGGVDRPDREVNHINGIKTDNRFENLEWSTRDQNMKHAGRIGLMPCGPRHHWYRVTNDTRRRVITLRGEGLTFKRIAELCGISVSHAGYIVAKEKSCSTTKIG